MVINMGYVYKPAIIREKSNVTAPEKKHIIQIPTHRERSNTKRIFCGTNVLALKNIRQIKNTMVKLKKDLIVRNCQ